MRRITYVTSDRLAAAGFHVFSLHQIPADDGRKLKRCPIPSDPWFAMIGNSRNALEAAVFRSATGATADSAVLAALPSSDGLKGALARLSGALDDLIGAYR